MKYVCEHATSESEDEKFLLDDDNTSKYHQCTECNKQNNGFINTNIQKETFGWLGNGNITMNNHYVPVNNFIEEDSNGDVLRSHDIPLLINGSLTDRTNENAEFHCHSNSNSYNDALAWKKLVVVSLICIILMITELIGGCIAGSLAVMTDAAHLLTDLIGFCISIISMWLGKKTPNRTMTFGYVRSEVIGAFLSILTVWLLAGVFCYLALHRLFRKEYNIDATTMLIVASIGVAINIVMASVLHGICHGHGHGHSHGSLISNANENINVRAAAAHIIGDLCQSFGVLLAAIIIKVYPAAQVADPICTLMFSIVAIYTTIKIARDVGKILLEASSEDVGNLIQLLKNIPGVKHVHEMHMWSLAPGREVLNVHLAVDKNCDRDEILEQASNLINIKTSIVSSTIQIEKYNSELISECNQCQFLTN